MALSGPLSDDGNGDHVGSEGRLVFYIEKG